MIRTQPADLNAKFDHTVELPEDYVLVSVSRYPGGRNPFTGKQLSYNTSVQIARLADLEGEPKLASLVRGVGDSVDEAIQHALDNL